MEVAPGVGLAAMVHAVYSKLVIKLEQRKDPEITIIVRESLNEMNRVLGLK